MHMIPGSIAGTPSMMNMNRQPANSANTELPLEVCHEDRGEPATLASGLASMNSAGAVARIELGYQYVRQRTVPGKNPPRRHPEGTPARRVSRGWAQRPLRPPRVPR